jgi:hypothetical protein
MAWHEVSDERPPTPPRRTELQKSGGEERPSLGETLDWDIGGSGWFPTEMTTNLMDPPPPRPVTPVRKTHRSSGDLQELGGVGE